MSDKNKKITVNYTCAECGNSWKETSYARNNKRLPEIKDCFVGSEECPVCNELKEVDSD